MPLKLGSKQTDDYFLVGLDDDNNPVALLPGQVATVTSADPATVVITPDATPRPTAVEMTLADGTVVPAGSVTQQSGVVSIAPNAAAPNSPINVTAHIANEDGSPVLDDTGAPVGDVVDTVTDVPGLLKKEGMLFGTPAAPSVG